MRLVIAAGNLVMVATLCAPAQTPHAMKARVTAMKTLNATEASCAGLTTAPGMEQATAAGSRVMTCMGVTLPNVAQIQCATREKGTVMQTTNVKATLYVAKITAPGMALETVAESAAMALQVRAPAQTPCAMKVRGTVTMMRSAMATSWPT